MTTYTAIKAQLVTVLTAALATASQTGGQVQVAYAWPGTATESECVFLGRSPADGPITTDITLAIPGIKVGRKPREESYRIDITVWSFSPDLTPADAATAESRAEAISDLIEDVFADDIHIGLPSSTIHGAVVVGRQMNLHPHDAGWAVDLVLTVEVTARLT